MMPLSPGACRGAMISAITFGVWRRAITELWNGCSRDVVDVTGCRRYHG